MSSIQMNSEELYKKCCVYMLWTDIVFRYGQAEVIKDYKRRKSWFKWKEYSYEDTYDFITSGKAWCAVYTYYHECLWYRSYDDNKEKVYNLMLLCKNGNPVTVTTEDSFVLNLIFTKELANLGITPDEAVEICETDGRVFK